MGILHNKNLVIICVFAVHFYPCELKGRMRVLVIFKLALLIGGVISKPANDPKEDPPTIEGLGDTLDPPSQVNSAGANELDEAEGPVQTEQSGNAEDPSSTRNDAQGTGDMDVRDIVNHLRTLTPHDKEPITDEDASKITKYLKDNPKLKEKLHKVVRDNKMFEQDLLAKGGVTENKREDLFHYRNAVATLLAKELVKSDGVKQICFELTNNIQYTFACYNSPP